MKTVRLKQCRLSNSNIGWRYPAWIYIFFCTYWIVYKILGYDKAISWALYCEDKAEGWYVSSEDGSLRRLGT